MADRNRRRVPDDARSAPPPAVAATRRLLGPGRAIVGAVLGAVGFVVAHQHISTTDTASALTAAAEDGGRSLVLFGLWWALIGALGGLGVAAAWHSLVWLLEVARHVPAWSLRTVVSVAAPTVAVVGAWALVWVSDVGTVEDAGLPRALTADVQPIRNVSLLCAVPGFLAFGVVRHVARERVRTAATDAEIELLRGLRATTRRLLTLFGALLTLIVVATGMRRRALVAWSSSVDVPVEQVLLYGLMFALVLAFLYGTTAAALDARASALIDRVLPLPAPDDSSFLDRHARRGVLAEMVGAASFRQSFESGVLVAAPLLSALLGVATGG